MLTSVRNTIGHWAAPAPIRFFCLFVEGNNSAHTDNLEAKISSYANFLTIMTQATARHLCNNRTTAAHVHTYTRSRYGWMCLHDWLHVHAPSHWHCMAQSAYMTDYSHIHDWKQAL